MLCQELWLLVYFILYISFLFSISEQQIKQAVAAEFNLTMKNGELLLGQFMHSMTIIRNLCAHGSRLYNRLFEQKPSLNKGELALLYRKQDGTCDNAHLYGFILIMRRLLLPDDFAAMKASIIALTEKYPFVRMSYYGFRSDWKTALWWFWFKKHIIVLTSPTSRKAQYCGRSVGGGRENLFPLFI